MPEAIERGSGTVSPKPKGELHITFEGKQERGVEVHYEVEREGWSSYSLEDGTTVKIKNVVSRVVRLLDRTKEDGSPFYVLEGTNVVTTIRPEPASKESGEDRAGG